MNETQDTEPKVEDAQPIENPEGFAPTAAEMGKDIPMVTCVP